MTLEDARKTLSSFADVVESSHHGHPDFRVDNKIFATLQPEKNRSVLRLPLPFAESLEIESSTTYRVVSRTGGNGWLAVDLAQTTMEEYAPVAELAWEHFLAKGIKRHP